MRTYLSETELSQNIHSLFSCDAVDSLDTFRAAYVNAVGRGNFFDVSDMVEEFRIIDMSDNLRPR